MPRFRYSARTHTGELREGVISAPDRTTAIRLLQADHLWPVSLNEDGGPSPAATAPAAGVSVSSPTLQPSSAARRRAWSARALAQFCRDLSDLMGAGMTLGDALHKLARRRDPGIPANVLGRVRDQIVGGASLSEALSTASDRIPVLMINMVRAGETSGRLAETLARLADHYEQVASTREKVIAALIYPSIVLVVGLLTVVFAFTFVVPRFEGIFRELGSTLPAPTRMLLAIGRGVVRYGPLGVLGLAVAALVVERVLRTDQGRSQLDRWLLRAPLLGPIVQAGACSRFARTLGSLLANGVPVLQALAVAETTVGNRVLAEAIREARERVTGGATISAPLAHSGRFPPLLTDMLAVGEETGDLPGALERIARRYDNELERRLRVFLTVLEPTLLISVALCVGFIAISLLSAVFEMTRGL